MPRYRRVTSEDRLQIKAYLNAGLSKSEVARKLGFHKSTISRELQRNSGGRGYRPKQAQRFADDRRGFTSRPRRLTASVVKRVNQLIRLRWSPQQIAERNV